MRSEYIKVKEYQCEGCGFSSIDVIAVLECEKRCILQKVCFHDILEYDCGYERRSGQMHCIRCDKHGSRKELREDGDKNKIDYNNFN